MFKDHKVIPANFNVICEPITEITTQKSDHENGYYIVSGLWGTCFHRIATKKDRFEIVGSSKPKCSHTYTKIPAKLAGKTFFLYVNYKEGFKIKISKGCMVVGMHEAQKSKIGGWFSQSFLIYCPNSDAPSVEETNDLLNTNEAVICINDKSVLITVEKIMHGFDVRFIAVGEDGMCMETSTRPERECNFPFTRNTTKIGDLFQHIHKN